MIRPAVVNRRVKKITKKLGRGAGAHSPHAVRRRRFSLMI